MIKIDKHRLNIANNLNTLLFNYKLAKGAFEIKFGMSQGQLTKYLKGETSIKTDLLAEIGSVYNVSLDTLVFGELKKRSTPYSESTQTATLSSLKEDNQTYDNTKITLNDDLASNAGEIALIVRWLTKNHKKLLDDPLYQLYTEHIASEAKNPE